MEEIRIYPDPILMKEAAPVQNIDGRVKEIVDCMLRAMEANRGIGLAAPQIGILSRIIVVGLERERRALINPELLAADGESTMEEGCLSVPALTVSVKRKENISIRAWDLDEKEMNWEVSGFPGRVIQHEIDHLRGILIINHISRLKRNLWLKKRIKDRKRSRSEGSVL
jgi:peptide deformylase